MIGQVVGICLSEKRGSGKRNIGQGYLREGYGLVGDAHAGTERPISVLSIEAVREAAVPKGIEAGPGDFAENITVQGLDLKGIKKGQRLRLGEAEVEVLQVGKEIDASHTFSFHGMALLVTQGCFCGVTHGGQVRVGDQAEFLVQTP
ncbi:MAG: MOSC domain-containing protein [Firmicutes bacterium]|nr:MOSC domain-containing protein [Bacillota bacterium]